MSRGTLNYTTPGTGSPLGVEDLSGTGAGPFWPTYQIGGAAAAEILRIKNSAPASTDYGAVVRPLLYDASGNPITQTSKGGNLALPVDANAIQLPTYMFSVRGVATGALTAGTAKPILSIEKTNAANTVKIRRILVSGFQTTALAGLLDIQFNRGTAASTGGTAASVNGGPRVTGDAANTVVTVKSLPTIVAATIVDVIPCGVTPSTVATGFGPIALFDWQETGETKPWTLIPSVIDSLVFNAISTAAQNWTLTFHITLTIE